MPKDAYWFKHDSNASGDLKLKALRRHYGWEGSGWYWFIIERLREEDGYQMLYGSLTFDSLADDFKCDPSKVQNFIDYCITPCQLLAKNETHFHSPRLTRDMNNYDSTRELRSKAGKKSASIRFPESKTITHVKQVLNTCSPRVELGEERRGEEIRGDIKEITKEKATPFQPPNLSPSPDILSPDKKTSRTRATTEAEFLEYVEQTKADFKDLDCEVEFKKFQLWWSEGGKKIKRPKTAWFNWLTKAREIKSQKPLLSAELAGGNGRGQHSQNTRQLPQTYTKPDDFRRQTSRAGGGPET